MSCSISVTASMRSTPQLQKGSVTVKPGSKVKRGQVIGKLGNTGNTSAPHLHFHIMTGPSVLGSDGVPYVIGRFSFADQVSVDQFNATTTLTGFWGQGRLNQPSPRTDISTCSTAASSTSRVEPTYGNLPPCTELRAATTLIANGG